MERLYIGCYPRNVWTGHGSAGHKRKFGELGVAFQPGERLQRGVGGQYVNAGCYNIRLFSIHIRKSGKQFI